MALDERRSRDLARYASAARRLLPMILGVAVVFAIWHRIGRETQQESITGDEGISLLASTCHQTEFLDALTGHREPYGQWVSSRAWKRYTTPERFGCFGTISRDLAAVDLHPPLYFWLLHLWLSLVGLHAWTFVSLNALFAIGTIAESFVLGRRLFGSALSGATLGFLWAASPLPAVAGVEGRPYELLAFVTVGFLAQVVRCCSLDSEPGRRPLAALAAWVTAGVLTHYLFLIVIAGAAIFASVRLARRAHRSLFVIATAVLVGACVACVVHPVLRQLGAKHETTTDEIGSPRFSAQNHNVVGQERLFFAKTVWGFTSAWPVGVAGLISIAVGWSIIRRRNRNAALNWRPQAAGADILLAVIAIASITAFLYASGRLPQHAMGAKYLSFLWPLFALALVAAARLLTPIREALQIAAIWIFAVAGWQNAPDGIDLGHLLRPVASESPEPLVYLTNSWHPTAASIARRRDDAPLFIASPSDGAASLYETWLQRINNGETLHVGAPRKYAKPVLARLRADGYTVTLPASAKAKKPPPVLWFSVGPRHS